MAKSGEIVQNIEASPSSVSFININECLRLLLMSVLQLLCSQTWQSQCLMQVWNQSSTDFYWFCSSIDTCYLLCKVNHHWWEKKKKISLKPREFKMRIWPVLFYISEKKISCPSLNSEHLQSIKVLQICARMRAALLY